MRNQLLDAASSVPANLVEGFRRYSPGEFPRFIDYSLASLGSQSSACATESRLAISGR